MLAYLKHHFKAKSRFNVHSPFVYQLVEEVLRNHSPYPEFEPLNRFRKSILDDHSTFHKTELGAGPLNSGLTRQVGKEAAKTALPRKYGKLLFRLIRDKDYKKVLELGTGLGIGTAYLVKALEGKPGGKLVSVEGCPQTLSVASGYLDQLTPAEQFPEIELMEGAIAQSLEKAVSKFDSIDIVVIDADHRKKSVLNYLEMILPFMNDSGVIVLDDINWSTGMQDAWRSVTKHPGVSLTIDLFRMGLVFVSQKLPQETYTLRY